jgi:hypothetical protein
MLIAGTLLFAYDVFDKLRSRREVTAPEDVRLPGPARSLQSDD